MTALAAAVFAGLAAALICPTGSRATGVQIKSPDAGTRVRRLRIFAAVGVGVACIVLIDGLFGWVVAVLATFGAWRWLSSRPDEREVDAKRRRRDELPVVVDLLAACLASGAPALASLQLVAETAGSTIGGQLRQVAGALSMGASEDEAWALLAGDDTAPIVETLCRTAKSGTPAAEQLRVVAGDLRVKARESAMNDARKLGVRTAGPLGLCFLPAFVLIGVVPLVASLVEKWT